jgi:hypothetical protein
MAEIQTVVLEMLRAGPAHNQLLSPLTPYIALCGAEGPVTVHIPIEHRQLLIRLGRLRYWSAESVISAEQREAEVLDLGMDVGKVLASVPALSPEITAARQGKDIIINLRLVVSGSELALIPFELATAPPGFPGSGQPLFLQVDTPIALTREIRRGRPLPVDWNRRPRILFVAASPKNVAAVPAQEHLDAIRRALEPWVTWAATAEERVDHVMEHVRILMNPSLDDIRTACAATEYTHVHILAHGVSYEHAGDQRYGLALCAPGSNAQEIVEGRQLAQALRAKDLDGDRRSNPNVVTLATCDSGNVGSVMVPGGSIAHDLHAFGIPWVVASQFPLTMAGSVIMTEVLYRRLLRGDDPRAIQHEIRQRLNTGSRTDHDWASLVIYAAIPPGFTAAVEAFRDRQTQTLIDVALDRAQKMIDLHRPAADVEPIFEEIRKEARAWRDRGPRGSAWALSYAAEVERFGMSGAIEKRIAELRMKTGDHRGALVSWRESRDWYREAVEKRKRDVERVRVSHWVLTQYLSLSAVLKERVDPTWWTTAREMVEAQLKVGVDASEQAWANATLAELALLATVYGDDVSRDPSRVREQVINYCREIRRLVGDESFHVSSTCRQFQRYLDFDLWKRAEWQGIAQAAIDALTS